MSLYDGFVAFSQRDEQALLADLADDGQRRRALEDAARDGDLIDSLLADVLPDDRMRCLVF